ncbi:hypothetical protein F2P81_019545 [Scophthalmus maximus]|uniref:Uncharacterized protein n=1 Tax=Scophthalmus maximus TaxID=52904 RepID=A0A6A4S8B3_SCOMX|nr:hypothetical protein F2P81_019545 [Scophthalmus maximus]
MSELPSDVSWCFSPRVTAELQLEVTNSSLRVRREEHDASSGKKTGKKLFADGHETRVKNKQRCNTPRGCRWVLWKATEETVQAPYLTELAFCCYRGMLRSATYSSLFSKKREHQSALQEEEDSLTTKEECRSPHRLGS